MHSWQASADWQTLERRSAFFAHIRNFFSQHHCLEVHVPILQAGANLDRGIELFQTTDQHYLISSPEHYLKRLLCHTQSKPRDCYAITPCFRREEAGKRHNPEFHMLEWYRLDWNLDQLIEECCALIQSCIPSPKALTINTITYYDAFIQSCGLNPYTASIIDLQTALNNTQFNQRDILLDLCMVDIIEPSFNPQSLTILRDYPADQAAQARTATDKYGHAIAHRFEVYYQHLELANGYWECTNAQDIRQRMEHGNEQGQHLDEAYLSALEHGLPECSGVALGLDRLFMLQQGLDDIRQAMAFPFNH